MTRVKVGMRQRARRPKTSTGCKTCRTRRIKCDEQKPACQRCILSKRTCLYSEDSLENSTASALSISSSSASPPPQPALAQVLCSPLELRAFQYFQEQTTPQLCCYHDCELWNSGILRAAQTDPCIRHAVIALSSFHEIFTLQAADWRTTNAFALQNYNLAIRHQIQSSVGKCVDGEDADRYMTASILFVIIELLQDHYVSAFSLLSNAIKLGSASSQHDRRTSAWPRQAVEALIHRLQLQAFNVLGPDVAAEMGAPAAGRLTYPSIPKAFSSIAEARACLEALVTNFTFAQNREEKDVLLRCADLVEGARMMLSGWSSAFQGLLDRIGGKLSRQEEQGINVLRIWQLRAIATLEAAVTSPHMSNPKEVWDSLRMLGEKIVSLAETVVANAAESPNRRTRTFTLDHGIVEPIMATGMMCRDPHLRQRIIHILRRCQLREGLYDSALVTCVVERATQIEEAAAPEARESADIPQWARVDSVLPTFQFGDRHAVFQITRQQQGSPHREKEVFEEVVSW